jgi:hypothetical protein
MADIVELGPDAVHGRHIVRVHADDARAAVIDDVGEVGRGEPEIDRHEHRPDLRNGVERFELLMGVGCDVGDTVARPDAETLKRGRPSVGAPEELLVRQAQRAVDHRLAPAVQPARAARELQGCQWGFHGTSGRALVPDVRK